jgi:hypothetical protein
VGPAGGLGSRDESLEKRFAGREAEGLEERPRGQKTIPAAALNRPFALLLMCTPYSLCCSVPETPGEAHLILFDINEHRAEEERSNFGQAKFYPLCVLVRRPMQEIHLGSCEGNLEPLRSYPEHLNLQNQEDGYTPLMYACTYGHDHCVKYLVENWASLTIRSEVISMILTQKIPFICLIERNDSVALCCGGWAS